QRSHGRLPFAAEPLEQCTLCRIRKRAKDCVGGGDRHPYLVGSVLINSCPAMDWSREIRRRCQRNHCALKGRLVQSSVVSNRTASQPCRRAPSITFGVSSKKRGGSSCRPMRCSMKSKYRASGFWTPIRAE